MNPNQTDDYISLPFNYFVEILCHCPPAHLWEQQILSRIPSIPDFSPRVVRFDIGALLKAKDPDELSVKVFLYPDSHHAEVWLRDEWNQSNTKYFRSREESEEFAKQEAEKLRKWRGLSAYVRTNMGLDPVDQYAIHHKMVDALLSMKSIPVQFKEFPGIQEALQEFGNLKA